MSFLFGATTGGPLTGLFCLVLDLFQALLLARVLVTFFAPKSTNPLVTILENLTEPIVGQFRQIVAPVGNVDLPAVCAFFVADLLKLILGSLGLPF